MITVLFMPAAVYAADDVADTISYTTDAGEEIDFKESNFNRVCGDLTGENLDYVKFTLSGESKGILYYDYDDYSGTVTISYTGWDVDDNEFTGSVKIKVKDDDDDDDDDIEYTVDADDIAYSASAGSYVTFDDDNFNDVCEDLTDEELDYVKFTLPSSSKGTLQPLQGPAVFPMFLPGATIIKRLRLQKHWVSQRAIISFIRPPRSLEKTLWFWLSEQ